jgi:hypothetical protein
VDVSLNPIVAVRGTHIIERLEHIIEVAFEGILRSAVQSERKQQMRISYKGAENIGGTFFKVIKGKRACELIRRHFVPRDMYLLNAVTEYSKFVPAILTRESALDELQSAFVDDAMRYLFPPGDFPAAGAIVIQMCSGDSPFQFGDLGSFVIAKVLKRLERENIDVLAIKFISSNIFEWKVQLLNDIASEYGLPDLIHQNLLEKISYFESGCGSLQVCIVVRGNGLYRRIYEIVGPPDFEFAAKEFPRSIISTITGFNLGSLLFLPSLTFQSAKFVIEGILGESYSEAFSRPALVGNPDSRHLHEVSRSSFFSLEGCVSGGQRRLSKISGKSHYQSVVIDTL